MPYFVYVDTFIQQETSQVEAFEVSNYWIISLT